MNKLTKRKIRPRVLDADRFPKPSNFFYRLASNQRFLAVIGLIFLLFIIIPLARTRSQQRLIEREIKDVEEEIKNFESQSQEFEELKTYLQSQQSLEERARLNLNLKKSGEQLIVVDAPLPPSNDFSLAPEPEISNLLKWWRYFFGI